MEFRRQFWALAAVGSFLIAVAVVLERPLLLVAGAGVGGWLLAEQLSFVRAVTAASDGLRIRLEPSKRTVVTDETIAVTLSAERGDDSEVELEIEARPPVAAASPARAKRTLELAGRSRSARTTFELSIPVGGSHEFGRPLVTASDGQGLFRERLTGGVGLSIDVEPRAPRDVHVGQAGSRVATAYGEHDAGQIGTGLDPAELREYVPGDTANHIDWKATARLNEPHVREFEAETDRETALLFDHRASTGIGPAGETELDYLRQVALAFVNDARRLSDPLGFYAVGASVTHGRPPASTAEQYATVRRLIQDLQPAEQDGRAGADVTGPATARRTAKRLAGDDSAFGRTLRPYLSATEPYVSQLEEDPLVAAVRTHLTRLRGSVWTVIFTDDSRPVHLREAVKIARRGDEHVLVFVAPRVLFEPGALSDLERAYERYRAFEEYRRELARLYRVTAFEVGPGDRVDAILTAGRRGRTTDA